MTTSTIVSLIMALAPVFGIDPKVAVTVAIVESSLNPKAMGQAGEIGLFQIMPDIVKRKGFTKRQMKDPMVNIYVGLQMLEDAKKHCSHKRGNTWLVCYNYGAKNALRVHHPSLWPYVKKVNKHLKNKTYLRYIHHARN